jgi:hypothetical protein
MTQIRRVIESVRDFDEFTASDVQAETGLQRKHCSAYITELKYRGLVVDTDRKVRNFDHSRPARIFRWRR